MSTQLSAIGSEAEMSPAVPRCPASRRLGVFLLHWGHRHSQSADAFDLAFNLVADRDLPDAGWCSAHRGKADVSATFYDGRPEWMDDEQHELMSYIRARAWNGEYKIRKFDVPELTLHELDEMREVLVNNKDHPFNLPASFVAMSKKEELFYRLREKFMPRKSFAN
jgi:hypothetical protein